MPDGTDHGTQRHFDAETARLALAGLGAPRKTLPAKLFYDDEGCRLFGEITRLPEYYVTRTELGLLREAAPEVAARLPRAAALVEYGASDETKAGFLLDACERIRAYVPIDVAEGAVRAIAARLATSRPELAVHPVAADFMTGLRLPLAIRKLPRLGFFPGSTIGNLDPPAARRFLAEVHHTLGDAALFLVGVDLRKDPSILVPAYNDAGGVTAAFNLNLLRRLNREAAAAFDLSAFRHQAVWNDAESRIEMHLVSLRRQTVLVAGHPVAFEEGETIHTENSYKYGLPDFTALAAAAGWSSVAVWTDPAPLFSLHLLVAARGAPHPIGGLS